MRKAAWVRCAVVCFGDGGCDTQVMTMVVVVVVVVMVVLGVVIVMVFVVVAMVVVVVGGRSGSDGRDRGSISGIGGRSRGWS